MSPSASAPTNKCSFFSPEEQKVRLVQDETGREVVIPTNETVKEVLQRRLAKLSCEFVFPSPKYR